MAAVLQADDLDAINKYIVGAEIKTREAQVLRDEWIRWFDGLSWGDRYFDRPTYDRARNMRLEFELANSVSEAERAEVLQRARQGLSSEQAQGSPDRRDTSGEYSGRDSMGLGSSLALGFLAAAAGLVLVKKVLL